ncbi:helix-turn-helix domain-containing protein [Dehalobacter sp. DCM]|uniref:helix-turn-helix domain-containing protein n=1 Tax=Dehalobacter sp. DCM TaxID=2907827 RepID=UPI003081B978|nr:helix-turn-helix domain-containing protein [Dehalobacter sp. DCM]
MNDLKPVIAKNIIDLRKSVNWTQAELAQKLNYSDKAVSKWERAESIPDVIVLKEIADLFQVTIDYLLESEHTINNVPDTLSLYRKRNRLIVTMQSVALVFLIATILFVILNIFSINWGLPSWIVYIYALPVACIVLLVFNSIWGKGKINYAIISSLVWSVLLAVYVSFLAEDIWLIFFIGIPAQVIIVLWSNFKLKVK